MKIAIVGGTGRVARRIIAEALGRGHTVTAISRDPSMLEPRPGLEPKVGDALRPDTLAPLLAGHDIVVSSIKFRMSNPNLLIEAVRKSGVKRYNVVGGGGSLFVEPGMLMIDAPGFPEIAREEATLGKIFLDKLRTASDLEWTMLCPSATEFAPGERTGSFRLGGDILLVDANGRSHISYEDFAVAFVDEIEDPKHVRKRFTVGY
jgi:putative NADH-flavin reductase